MSNCMECGSEFKGKDTSKFCCNACRQKNYRNAEKETTVTNTPKYPQGQCHACGKEFAEIFKETGCICLECVTKGVTHESLGLPMCE